MHNALACTFMPVLRVVTIMYVTLSCARVQERPAIDDGHNLQHVFEVPEFEGTIDHPSWCAAADTIRRRSRALWCLFGARQAHTVWPPR